MARIVIVTVVGDPNICVLPSGEKSSRVKVSFVSGILSSTGAIGMFFVVSPGLKNKTPVGPIKSLVSTDKIYYTV